MASRLQVPKPKLTPEEAKQRAAELQARAKAKREAAERVNAKESEKLRIQMGKQLTAAAKVEQEQQFKRLAEARRMEKAEQEAARVKIQAKLDEDRCGPPCSSEFSPFPFSPVPAVLHPVEALKSLMCDDEKCAEAGRNGDASWACLRS